MWTVPETVPRPCLINWCSHTWECWICSLCWIFTKNNKCWENFNHICSYRCSFVRTGSNYANPFATYFTRFKVVKKSLGSLVLSYLMLNFMKLFTFFYFQGSYSGFGRMPTVSSGRRRNLVSRTKYCDDLLPGSHPYAPLSLSCFLSLEARPSSICPSWCTHLLLQPCLGIVPFPFYKKNPCLQSIYGPMETACNFCLAFSLLFLFFRNIYRILLCVMAKFDFTWTWAL